MYAAASFCYVCASCADPGVAEEPESRADIGTPHPGAQYTLSRDSNRYVRGFDHYCEFVGNDIGMANMPSFVAFLVTLAALSTYVAVRPESPAPVALRGAWRAAWAARSLDGAAESRAQARAGQGHVGAARGERWAGPQSAGAVRGRDRRTRRAGAGGVGRGGGAGVRAAEASHPHSAPCPR